MQVFLLALWRCRSYRYIEYDYILYTARLTCLTMLNVNPQHFISAGIDLEPHTIAGNRIAYGKKNLIHIW